MGRAFGTWLARLLHRSGSGTLRPRVEDPHVVVRSNESDLTAASGIDLDELRQQDSYKLAYSLKWSFVAAVSLASRNVASL